MVTSYSFHGLPIQTGDIICTQDGEANSRFGQVWRLLGRLVPGEVDHCLIYLGPGGRCVESAVLGVVDFIMPGGVWDSQALFERRLLLDTFYGVAYPLAGRNFPPQEEQRIRSVVARFCLEKVADSKPYNLNFLNPERELAFYCSQLVYKAYRAHGIDLNTNQEVPTGPLLDKIVFPQEIWNACQHRRVTE